MHEVTQLTGATLPYRSASDWAALLETDFEVVHRSEELHRLTFPDPVSVLHHLKATGVTGIRKERWNKTTLRTFAESYDFKGKTVVPFCTYASTFRDETLQKIVDLTPDAAHLTGLGARSGQTSGVQAWLNSINDEWEENGGSTGINNISATQGDKNNVTYDLSGRVVKNEEASHWVFIVSKNGKSHKVLK